MLYLKPFSSIKDPREAEDFVRLDYIIGRNAKPQPGSQAPAPQRPPRSVRVIKKQFSQVPQGTIKMWKKFGCPELIVVEY